MQGIYEPHGVCGSHYEPPVYTFMSNFVRTSQRNFQFQTFWQLSATYFSES